MIKSRIFFFPYWLTLKIRHWLYDTGRIKGKSYPIPVICIGNVTVGGTGKTPHVEMIIRLLQDRMNIAVLSRGYKRRTKGFHLLEESDSAQISGDEPLQIKQKFPDILVAVCEDRQKGIEEILHIIGNKSIKANTPDNSEDFPLEGTDIFSQPEKPWIIFLDDAFQHRRVIPSKNILLVDWNRPIDQDELLPLGNLRDLPEQKKRADIVIVTKCPQMGFMEGIQVEEAAREAALQQEAIWRKKLKLRPDQDLFFTLIDYCTPQGVFPKECNTRYIYSKEAIAFSGIATNKDFFNHVELNFKMKDAISFADHRNFTQSDISHIDSLSRSNPLAVVLTTEKDSKRLINSRYINRDLKAKLFFVPIKVNILSKQAQAEFISRLLSM